MPDTVIGISAELRGGKGTCVKILETIFHGDTSVISSGMILTDLAMAFERPDPTNRKTLQDCFSRAQKALGRRCLHSGIRERWEESKKRIWIFDGVLMPWDVEFIRSFPQNILFFVDCKIETRYKRARLAALCQEADAKPDEAKITLEEFKKMHEHETAKFVATIKNLSAVRVLDNNGTIKELGSQIKLILANTGWQI
ncbi:MAG: hypothetical protein HYT98_04200 [Candidatus Sungbacteria bacterium]|nr:hypothetical protein [Candidatus Sungbacteria bacterium]